MWYNIQVQTIVVFKRFFRINLERKVWNYPFILEVIFWISNCLVSIYIDLVWNFCNFFFIFICYSQLQDDSMINLLMVCKFWEWPKENFSTKHFREFRRIFGSFANLFVIKTDYYLIDLEIKGSLSGITFRVSHSVTRMIKWHNNVVNVRHPISLGASTNLMKVRPNQIKYMLARQSSYLLVIDIIK